MTCKLDRGREPLTERQAEMLRWIAAFTSEHRMPPTMREIGAAMNITSTNGVSDHLTALERKGYLRRDAMKSRAIFVLFDESGRAFSLTESAETRSLRARVSELEEQLAMLLGRLSRPHPSCASTMAPCGSKRCARRR